MILMTAIKTPFRKKPVTVIAGAVLVFFILITAASCMPISYEGETEEEVRKNEEGSNGEQKSPGSIADETGTIDTGALEPVEKKVTLEEWAPMRLVIPAIDLDIEVASDRHSYDPGEVGEKPWQFSTEDYNRWIRELMALLNEGPVHYQFSSLPGTEEGNVAIAGHSPSPWYHFYDLDRLKVGDRVYLDTAGYWFVYQVSSYEIVDKYNWEPLFETDYPALTFQTCHPKDYEGLDHPERLMVRADLRKVYYLPD